MAAEQLSYNGSDGATIGNTKCSLYGVTPVVQAAKPDAVTSGGGGATGGAFASSTERDAAIVTINSIRTALINVGILAA